MPASGSGPAVALPEAAIAASTKELQLLGWKRKKEEEEEKEKERKEKINGLMFFFLVGL